MAENENTTEGGIRYKGKNGEVAASEKTVEGVLHTLDVITERALGWSERNPTQFYAVLIFLLLGFLIWSRTRVKIAAQKNEFAARRLASGRQLPLPLPKPSDEDK